MKKFFNTHGPAIVAGIIVGISMLVIQYVITPKITEQKIKTKKK